MISFFHRILGSFGLCRFQYVFGTANKNHLIPYRASTLYVIFICINHCVYFCWRYMHVWISLNPKLSMPKNIRIYSTQKHVLVEKLTLLVSSLVDNNQKNPKINWKIRLTDNINYLIYVSSLNNPDKFPFFETSFSSRCLESPAFVQENVEKSEENWNYYFFPV